MAHPQFPTVLITGASGGIGEELARTFAAHGHNLVLVARSEARLQELATHLAQTHKVQAEVLVADLSQADAAQHVVEALDQRRISVDILVNNAGFATYGALIETDPAITMNMLQLNIGTLTHLTRLLLPGMVARRRGRVLNVASTAAFLPGPLMAVYYASKAYVLSFSEALNEELRRTGVCVTALCPGATSTGFQSRANMHQSRLIRGRTLMDAATVAQAGYQACIAGRPLVIPGLMNRVQAFLPRLLPRAVVPRIVRMFQDRAD